MKYLPGLFWGTFEGTRGARILGGLLSAVGQPCEGTWTSVSTPFNGKLLNL